MTNSLKFATPLLPKTTGDNIDESAIEFFQTQGFARIRGIITPEEADHYRDVALDIAARDAGLMTGSIFDQYVNVWTRYPEIKSLSQHPNIARAAEKLAGVALRLWHDQILIKKPYNSVATEFHQDQPYWPHSDSPNPISCWIALCDVPVDRGCMTFLPGSHLRTDLKAQDLFDGRSLFGLAPDMEYDERVTVPLRKGDCTFHHGRCAHMANPNITEDPRVAHVAIFIDATTKYDGQPHCVTDDLGLSAGDLLDGPLFPSVAQILNR